MFGKDIKISASGYKPDFYLARQTRFPPSRFQVQEFVLRIRRLLHAVSRSAQVRRISGQGLLCFAMTLSEILSYVASGTTFLVFSCVFILYGRPSMIFCA